MYWASPTAAPTTLPLPAGGTDAYTWGINDAGVIVGFVSVAIGKNKFVNRATRWVPSGGSWAVEFLPDLGEGSMALAINDAGQIAGSVYTWLRRTRPAFWDVNGMLRQLEGTGEAYAISEPVAGPLVAGTNSGTAVRWRP